MKVFNIIYKDKLSLKEFIFKNSIDKEKNILIQIFCGIPQKIYILELLTNIKDLLPKAKIIGSTTDGEICNFNITTYKTVISFCIFEKTTIQTNYATGKDSKELAQNLLKYTKKSNDLKLLITFTDGLKTNGEDFLKTIENLNNNLVVAGGLAADNAEFSKTLIFNENDIYDKGAVGAFFYNKNLAVHTEYNFGWQKIGKKLTITKSNKNIVYTIDNIPAKEIYQKYLGKNLLKKAIEFPLIIDKKNTSVARAILEVKDNGSLVFAGNVNQGAQVSFGFGEVDEILQKDISKYSNINNKPAEAFFVYSCMARRRLFGDNITLEILPLSNTIPTCGFFTYGELYHDIRNNQNELLNQTMTILSISENPNKITHITPPKEYEHKKFNKLSTIHTLLNLISITSKELQELNKTLETRIHKKTAQLEHRYYYNSITNLKNSNALLEDLKKYNFYSLFILDIDEFKNFNEIYGLDIGNEILAQFANYLKLKLNKDTYEVYHFHGDQFAIRLKINTPTVHTLKLIAKEIQHISKEFEFCLRKNSETLKLEITLGISANDDHPVQKALIALSHAKLHRTEYTIYSIEMDHSSISKDILRWKKRIKKAIKTDNIIPVFQPIVDKEQNIVKYEILMRMREYENNKEELISPIFFLDIAIKTKLYPELTKIIIEKSFKVIQKHKQKFSLNLSFEDIINQEATNFLKNNIIKYNIGKKLILEIVESSNVEDYKIVTNFIKEFKELGVEVAIDDFGAGFSNYIHIIELEPDYLKLDGSLIKDIDRSKKSYEFVKSISNLCKALGIKTIAEFIHSKEIFDICLSLEIDQFQGFYFSPPVKEEELFKLKVESV